MPLSAGQRAGTSFFHALLYSNLPKPPPPISAVEVLALHHFPSFAELYKNLPLQKCGYAEGEAAHPDDMLSYYPRERELLYGALGIELKLI